VPPPTHTHDDDDDDDVCDLKPPLTTAVPKLKKVIMAPEYFVKVWNENANAWSVRRRKMTANNIFF
jgi:hypothetical protein